MTPAERANSLTADAFNRAKGSWPVASSILAMQLEHAEAEVARLRDGLRFYANEDDYLWHGDERGTIQKNDRGAHARALLAEDGAA